MGVALVGSPEHAGQADGGADHTADKQPDRLVSRSPGEEAGEAGANRVEGGDPVDHECDADHEDADGENAIHKESVGAKRGRCKSTALPADRMMFYCAS